MDEATRSDWSVERALRAAQAICLRTNPRHLRRIFRYCELPLDFDIQAEGDTLSDEEINIIYSQLRLLELPQWQPVPGVIVENGNYRPA
jgi:hypothetical protein